MAAIESWRTSMSQELMTLTINMPGRNFPHNRYLNSISFLLYKDKNSLKSGGRILAVMAICVIWTKS